jgi:hypothetical protein
MPAISEGFEAKFTEPGHEVMNDCETNEVCTRAVRGNR